jgi:hypothetical protein
VYVQNGRPTTLLRLTMLSVLRFGASVVQFLLMIKPKRIPAWAYMLYTLLIMAVPNLLEVLMELYHNCRRCTLACNQRKRNAGASAMNTASTTPTTPATPVRPALLGGEKV